MRERKRQGEKNRIERKREWRKKILKCKTEGRRRTDITRKIERERESKRGIRR